MSTPENSCGFALLTVKLRGETWMRPSGSGDLFYFLASATDGTADALSNLHRGLTGLRLIIRQPPTLFTDADGRTRICDADSWFVTGGAAMFIHEEAVAWAQTTPDEVVLVPHADLITTLDPSDLTVSAKDICKFLMDRVREDSE